MWYTFQGVLCHSPPLPLSLFLSFSFFICLGLFCVKPNCFVLKLFFYNIFFWTRSRFSFPFKTPQNTNCSHVSLVATQLRGRGTPPFEGGVPGPAPSWPSNPARKGPTGNPRKTRAWVKWARGGYTRLPIFNPHLIIPAFMPAPRRIRPDHQAGTYHSHCADNFLFTRPLIYNTPTNDRSARPLHRPPGTRGGGGAQIFSPTRLSGPPLVVP